VQSDPLTERYQMTPEEFDRLFDGALTEWVSDAAQSLLAAYFPVAVIEQLRASSVPAPMLFFGYLKRLEGDLEAEESFAQDLFRLLGDEDGFEWPSGDLGRCLALAVSERIVGHVLLDSTCARQQSALEDANDAIWETGTERTGAKAGRAVC
jgi:hypothetical protein